MKRALAIVLAAAALFGTAPLDPAAARTATLYLERLSTKPAEILLVPGFLTILEFEDAVTAVATGNPSVVELVDVSGGTVTLRPRTGSGTTDIVVSVGEVRAMFRARITAQPRTTHKYVVSSSPAPEPERPPQRSSAPASQIVRREARSPQAAPQPTAQLHCGLSPRAIALMAELLASLPPAQREALLRSLATSGTDCQRPAAQPQQQPPQAAPVARPQPQPPQAGSGPAELDWQLAAQRTGSGTVIQYTLTNSGQRTVLTDVLRLRVTTGNGQPARYTLSRVSPSGFSGRINPGETEAGTIFLHEDPGGPITLEWRIVEIGSGITYTLTRTIQ